jgi:hypothetical protein
VERESSCDGSLLEGRSMPPVRAVAAHLHCNENPIYVFPENNLRGLSPNFHIHVSVSDYILPGSVHIRSFLQQNR